MTQIVWIASYPGSGSTWVRALVANIIYGEVAASVALMDLVPDIHVAVNASHLHGDTTTFVKTHWAYHERLPLREDTAGAIYVTRHPLDVIASNLNGFLLRQDDGFFAAPETEQTRRTQDYIDGFITEGGAAEWHAQGIGTWPENVVSWLERGVPFPRLTVRYEDLKRDPTEFVTKLCAFCNVERSEAEIAGAVENASFARLRTMEEREIANETPGLFTTGGVAAGRRTGLRLMHQGTTGGFRAVLSEPQIAKAAETFEDVMKVFGYRA